MRSALLWSLGLVSVVGLAFDWTQHIGGSATEDRVAPVVTADSSGSVFLAAYTESTDIYFNGSLVLTRGAERRAGDLVVFKVAGGDGSLLWVEAPSAGDGRVGAIAIATDASDNLYIAGTGLGTSTFGSTTITANGGTHYFLAKISSSGVWQWATHAGGQDTELGYDLFLAVTAAGDAFITDRILKSHEFTFGSINVADDNVEGSSGKDVHVAKCSSDGVWAWVATSAKPVAGHIDSAIEAIALLPSGGVAIAGTYGGGTIAFGSAATLTSAGNQDAFVARVSDAGVWEWAASGGGPDTDVTGISVAADGSIGLTGTMKFPANGDGSYGAQSISAPSF